MWLWVVLLVAYSLGSSGATLDFGFFNRKQYVPTPQVNCVEMPRYTSSKRITRMISDNWQPIRTTVQPFPVAAAFSGKVMKRKLDQLFYKGEDIVKEHAKLVQDINSLKQVMFVAPFNDDYKDYDDSIFHEIFESTTTTLRPTTKKQVRTTKATSIPIILLGGSSQHQKVVRSPPLQVPKPTISLIGTSITPLMKHPYPFVVQASTKKPIKVCITATYPTIYPTTRRPTLWERLVNSIIPR